jgi:membrane-bound lytic murein transglycosylase F
VLFLSLLLILSACSDQIDKDLDKPKEPSQVVDLAQIKEKGKLRAIIDNSSTSYFIYKGQPMGFEYELLSRFAEHINVDIEVDMVDDLGKMIENLKNNKGDVIAANLTITKARKEQIDYSNPILTTRQVLVQRQLQAEDIQKGKLLVESPTELMYKKVYVQKESSFYNRLKNLSEEIGGDIEIQEVAGNFTVEQMIEKVAEGDIDYTVADEHVAKINQAYFRNININTPLSLEQKVAWGIRKESAELQIAINDWLEDFKKTVDFRVIYLKYYGNTTLFRNRVNNRLFTSRSGKLSDYDAIVKKKAEIIGWDWRLITSLIYQESKFNPQARSWVGAQGLMQLMPSTSAEYGLDSNATVSENIEAGLKYLKWIDQQFQDRVNDSTERQKFVIASYNVGLGHVFDAMRLAESRDLNPEVWDGNVAEMLLKKSDPDYYQDSVVHYGYCRGREPYQYVREIYNRYNDYVNITQSGDDLVKL